MKEASGWYLVFTKPKQENTAQFNLQRQGFNTYLPLQQQHKHKKNLYHIVTEPLFPRYLFIRLNYEIDDWSKIRSTRGCVSLVRFGQLPALVPPGLVEHLKNEEGTRLISDQKIVPDFKSGDRVQIIEGLFKNYEGIVENKNSQQRITILLNIVEAHARSVNLSIHQVKIAR